MNDSLSDLEHKLRMRSARIAIVGLGYAGLPMAVEFGRAGFACVGVDVDASRVDALVRGRSPVSNVADADVAGGKDPAMTKALGVLRKQMAPAAMTRY